MLANKSGSLTKRVVIPVDQTHNLIPVDQTHNLIMTIVIGSHAIEEVAAAMSSMSAQTFSISTISDGCGA